MSFVIGTMSLLRHFSIMEETNDSFILIFMSWNIVEVLIDVQVGHCFALEERH